MDNNFKKVKRFLALSVHCAISELVLQFCRPRYVLVSCPMVQLSILSQDEKGERVTSISHVPCCYAAGLSSSFKDTSSPTGGPIVVTANRKLKRE